MRIMFIDNFQLAGRCRSVFSLAGELSRQGFSAFVTLLGAPPGIARQFQQFYGVPVLTGQRFSEAGRFLKKGSVDLLHLQAPSLLNQGSALARTLGIPYGVTVAAPLADPPPEMMRGPAFIIASRAEARVSLQRLRPDTVLIPEGIDVARCQPAVPKNGFQITLVNEGSVSGEGALALAKAAGICGADLQIIGRGGLPEGAGSFYGWPPCPAPVLAGSQVVAGQGRALLEGAACGNAVIALGQRYLGPAGPDRIASLPALEKEGGGEEPCYRTVLGDLNRLMKDRAKLEHLQEWGRRWVRDYHDLRLVAEMTARVYHRAAGVSRIS